MAYSAWGGPREFAVDGDIDLTEHQRQYARNHGLGNFPMHNDYCENEAVSEVETPSFDDASPVFSGHSSLRREFADGIGRMTCGQFGEDSGEPSVWGDAGELVVFKERGNDRRDPKTRVTVY